MIQFKAFAQPSDLYMPLEISEAYKRGTRSLDGNPGPQYWQNTVDYDIQVELDPVAQTISGAEKITYYNNSPDRLDQLVFRIYHDVYKKGEVRLESVDPLDIHDGVVISNLKIEGELYPEEDPSLLVQDGSRLVVVLKKPLEAGKSLEISLEWKQPIPGESDSRRRQGAHDSTIFFVAQWYPQLSVYDDLFGWDMSKFLFEHEFYNNLGNFNVEISVPTDFTVWATGVLQNPEEVLNPSVLSNYKTAMKSENTIQVIGEKEALEGIKHKGSVWKFSAREVPDFAFGTSNKYIWESGSYELNGINILINAVYPVDSTRDFSEFVPMLQRMMRHFSTDAPGVPYPYPSFTSFVVYDQKAGGMEYPMIANNRSNRRGLNIHEMFHTYFPMHVRVNETQWSWMDEGPTNHFTTWVNRLFEDEEMSDRDGFSRISLMGKFDQLPLLTPTYYLNETNAGQANYSRPANILSLIRLELGNEMFLKCFQEYISRWAKKSPSPYDLFFTFEDVSGQNLKWLWEPWFFEWGYADLKIKGFQNRRVEIQKMGNKPAPVFLDVYYSNGDTLKVNKGPGIWKDGNRMVSIEIPDAKEVKAIILNQEFQELDYADNFYPEIKTLYNEDVLKKLVGEFSLTGRRWSRGTYGILFKQKEGILSYDLKNKANPNYLNSKILYPLGDMKYLSIPFGGIWTFEVEEGMISGYFGDRTWEIRKIDPQED